MKNLRGLWVTLLAVLSDGAFGLSNPQTQDDWIADQPAMHRRSAISCLLGSSAIYRLGEASASTTTTTTTTTSSSRASNFRIVRDPATYEAFIYTPPNIVGTKDKVPLLLVLHGAGQNDRNALDLADTNGEHRGLAPSLLASGRAPDNLANNFCVVAPYSAGKRSFSEEPRSQLLKFLSWILSEEGKAAGCPTENIDYNRICLFGFSDGATVAVELATTQRFRAVVICAYGFTGVLPSLAVQRLQTVPIWIHHAVDDVIFPVRCSDNLYGSLKSARAGKVEKNGELLYTRYSEDPEGCTGSVKGHCVGITASKSPAVYDWMLNVSS